MVPDTDTLPVFKYRLYYQRTIRPLIFIAALYAPRPAAVPLKL